ncbi:malonyl-ACP O-methyltransferase BioC [Methylomarinum vadi]|uniref:malonyl-ACP O-methyltransferase BioC n=1 Tax=Methylomarinum vadi TaxID=438855 RepID=UPI0004DEED2D|nr:malonyl-ACP O-methyltransferase BioC [Methylomarinum vadi]
MNALLGLDKNKVRRSFSAASDSYDGLAELQRRVALRLLDKTDFSCNVETIVDVGCGTGFFTRHALKRFQCKQMLAMDIALPMLDMARQNIVRSELNCFCADAENLPLASSSVDKIMSNLALQWCLDLDSVFAGFRRVLKEDGKLLFSTFGPATLQELKTAWATVDRYSHVNDFYSLKQIERILRLSGFRPIMAESVMEKSFYPSVMALMNELKGIGAHNVTKGRNKNPTTRSQLQQMIAAYPVDEKQRVTASYEIIYIAAEKV